MSPDEKTKVELDRDRMDAEADKTNASRTGVGTRVKVGATRGRNVSVISYEAFDDSKPETLPKSLKEFIDITKSNEQQLLEYAIVGFNDAQYSAASDEIGEYVNPAWDKDTQTQFRIVVRNYSKSAEVSIEEAVALIKPGVEKKFASKKST